MLRRRGVSHIIMSQLLQELYFSISSFGNHRAIERLHHFLDRNHPLCNHVVGGAAICQFSSNCAGDQGSLPDDARSAEAHWL